MNSNETAILADSQEDANPLLWEILSQGRAIQEFGHLGAIIEEGKPTGLEPIHHHVLNGIRSKQRNPSNISRSLINNNRAM